MIAYAMGSKRPLGQSSSVCLNDDPENSPHHPYERGYARLLALLAMLLMMLRSKNIMKDATRSLQRGHSSKIAAARAKATDSATAVCSSFMEMGMDGPRSARCEKGYDDNEPCVDDGNGSDDIIAEGKGPREESNTIVDVHVSRLSIRSQLTGRSAKCEQTAGQMFPLSITEPEDYVPWPVHVAPAKV